MRVLESLHERVPDVGAVQRAVVLGPDNGASHVSAVVVRIPPQHEFPLHTHPHSEDCFFALSGAGEVFGPSERYFISEPAGVWIPAGVPHGLAAGSSGMLEIGFQSPPDPTAVPFATRSGADNSPRGIMTESLPVNATSTRAPEWMPVFPRRVGWQYLDPHYCVLDAAQELRAHADGYELLVVVARGAIELREVVVRVGAVGAVQLRSGECVVMRALEGQTLLLGIRSVGKLTQN
jgi:quercetin dioxygenase-like cupin family protein